MTASSSERLSGVTKRFHRRAPWVLAGIDLTLEPNSRTVIVGGNGSGKSTLLRVAAGLTAPTSGSVATPATIGYVLDRLPGRIPMSGIEYLAHMGRIKGLDSGLGAARTRELFERLDLQPGPRVPFGALSKGNRQKLVLAQAFLGLAELLVLDDPTAASTPELGNH